MPRKNDGHRRPLSILFEDADWVAVEKPAGVAVHPGAGAGVSVVERIHEELGARLHLVHRLDRGTAGVLLLARTAQRAREAAKAWPRVRKHYFAITAGRVSAPRKLSMPLRDGDGRARDALTQIRASWALDRWPRLEASVCLACPETGRLHQIRKHLAGIGNPILMDDRHGDFSLNRDFRELTKNLKIPRPKYPLLFCRSLRGPPEGPIPTELTAPWPRHWPEWVDSGGLSIDALGDLA